MVDWRCRGQYSDAVLNELESQNDGQVEGILGKVSQLKAVSFPLPSLHKENEN
jgi:blocked-early-in-transport protein 1